VACKDLCKFKRKKSNKPHKSKLKGNKGEKTNLIQLQMSLLIAGRLDWMAFKGPFQPKPFYGSMK